MPGTKIIRLVSKGKEEPEVPLHAKYLCSVPVHDTIGENNRLLNDHVPAYWGTRQKLIEVHHFYEVRS